MMQIIMYTNVCIYKMFPMIINSCHYLRLVGWLVVFWMRDWITISQCFELEHVKLAKTPLLWTAHADII